MARCTTPRCGAAQAPAVLLLHQTPRSWAEYRAVLPLLGASYRAIAMDTAGFGESDPVPAPSIEAWADAAAQLLGVLRIERCHVVGHHTGGVIAVELAARHAGRVGALVLSSTPFTNAAFRTARAQRPRDRRGRAERRWLAPGAAVAPAAGVLSGRSAGPAARLRARCAEGARRPRGGPSRGCGVSHGRPHRVDPPAHAADPRHRRSVRGAARGRVAGAPAAGADASTSPAAWCRCPINCRRRLPMRCCGSCRGGHRACGGAISVSTKPGP